MTFEELKLDPPTNKALLTTSLPNYPSRVHHWELVYISDTFDDQFKIFHVSYKSPDDPIYSYLKRWHEFVLEVSLMQHCIIEMVCW